MITGAVIMGAVITGMAIRGERYHAPVDDPGGGDRLAYSYQDRRGVCPVSWQMFTGLCKGLALAVAPFAPDAVVGIARGGLYPAAYLAQLLRCELVPVRLTRRAGDRVVRRDPEWMFPPPMPAGMARLLVVDEICDSGQTLRIAREDLVRLTGAEVRTCVLYSHSRAAGVPDHVSLVTDELVVNPWDREILVDGLFVTNPEYLGALSSQGLGAPALPPAVDPAPPVR